MLNINVCIEQMELNKNMTTEMIWRFREYGEKSGTDWIVSALGEPEEE
jgi:hypothetical protein